MSLLSLLTKMPKSDVNFDEMLIEQVRKYRFLYDPGHKDFQNIQKKNKVWNLISRKLKVDESRVKQRWKGLRATYIRCKKTENGINRVSGFPRPKWIFFKSMSFLDDISKSKYTGNKSIKDLFTQDCSDMTLSELSDSIDEESLKSLPMEEETHISVSSQPEVQEETHTSTSPMPEIQKEQNVTTLQEKIDKFFEFTASCLTESCVDLIKKRKQDSISLYFASLAAKIKEADMPQSRVNEIKTKVTELVFSEIEQYFDILEAGDVMA